MAIIETRQLRKEFKDLVAVNNLDLEIEEGECFGLLGPNGSGKTTLIRMITAVSPPTAGDIYLAWEGFNHTDISYRLYSWRSFRLQSSSMK